MEEIGTVISTEEGPSSSEFRFVVNDSNGMHVRKGEFVQLPFDGGSLVCRVEELVKENRYYSRPDSVIEYERSGKPLVEQFPVGRWEYLVARAATLGVYKDGMQRRSTFPVSPGQKVYKAENDILSGFLGFDKAGVNLGKMEFHDIEARLNMSKLFQKHLAILALSGAGKSYTTSVLIEELLNRPEHLGKPAVIVFDPHGEYAGFADDQGYASATKVVRGDDISIASRNLGVQTFSELIPQMTGIQERELSSVINGLKSGRKQYTLFDVMEEVENSVRNPKTRDSLVSWLSKLNYTGLFKSMDNPAVESMAKPGQLAVFDLSETTNMRKKQIIVTYFARRLFALRREKRVPPFVMIVEEAHQFAPNTEEESAISRTVIETMAREGRKFNACLVLISQRPKRLSTTALSQCNSNIILRITNPIDLQHIQESTEGLTADLMNMIPGLKVGEAIIAGEAVNYPVLIRVRKRLSKGTDKIMKLEDELLKSSGSSKSREEDMKAFADFK